MVTKAQTVKVLKESKELISDPKHWVKRTFESADRKRFCAAGAIKKIDGPAEESALVALARAIVKHYPEIENHKGLRYNYLSVYKIDWVIHNEPIAIIAAYNDRPGRPHSDIMDMFDRAIKEL